MQHPPVYLTLLMNFLRRPHETGENYGRVAAQHHIVMKISAAREQSRFPSRWGFELSQDTMAHYGKLLFGV
jgi:hypothetical protein